MPTEAMPDHLQPLKACERTKKHPATFGSWRTGVAKICVFDYLWISVSAQVLGAEPLQIIRAFCNSHIYCIWCPQKQLLDPFKQLIKIRAKCSKLAFFPIGLYTLLI